MKKKIFGSLAILAIAAVTVLNVNLGSQKELLSDISLANVEALAQDESDTWFYICVPGAQAIFDGGLCSSDKVYFTQGVFYFCDFLVSQFPSGYDYCWDGFEGVIFNECTNTDNHCEATEISCN
ncbi:NVEALA domain-containing protein [Viscerimonas tarda]